MATTRESAYRSLKIVLATFLLFAIPIGVVTYLYVKQKTDYFNQRKFRQLAVQAEQLQSSIENNTKYILPKLAAASEVKSWQERNDGKPFELQSLNTGPGFKLLTLEKQQPKTLKPMTPFQDGQSLWVDLDRWLDGIHLEASARIWDESDIGAERLFDRLLLVNGQGEVLFEKAAAPENLPTNAVRDDSEGRVRAVRAFDLVGLLVEAAGPRKKDDPDPRPAALAMLRNSGMRNVHLADEEYRMFVQPLHVSQDESTAARPTELERNWSLVGLSSVSRLRRESMTISYTVVLIVLFLFLLISLSWPFLKLWYQGPRERFGRVDVHFLAAHVLLITGLLTFFCADTYTYRRFEDALDGQLKDLADTVHNHLQNELEEDLRQARERGNQSPDWRMTKGAWNKLYDRVAWVDETGQQTDKWTSLDKNSATINVKSRSYFEELGSNGGWRWAVDGQPIRFWLGTIRSWTTGDRQAILAVPWPAKRQDGSIVTIGLRLLSLRDPVLPPSFAFAVIRGDGEVLFHSDRSHESENIFVETDRNPELRAAVFGRAKDWMNASYLGQGHRLYVLPVGGLPWSIVAFRSKDLLRTTNVEILSSAFVMFLVYVLVAMWPIATVLGWKADWCWPNSQRNREYTYLAVVYALVILLMSIIIGIGKPAPILFAAVLVPPACLWVAHRRLNHRRGDRGRHAKLAGAWLALASLVLFVVLHERLNWWQAVPLVGLIVASALGSTSWIDTPRMSTSWGATRKRYLTTASLFVVIAGILPALGFFRIASRVETGVYVRHTQRGLTDAFWGRIRRVNAEIRGEHAEADRTKRLATDRDVYARMFFETQDPGPWNLPVSSAKSRSGNCLGIEPSNLRSAYESIRLLYNDIAVGTHELVNPTMGDCTLRWSRDHNTEELYVAPSETPLLKSDLPEWLPPPALNWFLALVGGALALLLLVVYLTRLLAARVVLIDLDEPPDPVNVDWTPKELNRSTLLLGPPSSGKSALLRDDGVLLIDLRTVTANDGWATKVHDAGSGGKPVVAFDHLEHRWDDPKANRGVLLLVEQLINRGGIVVIASAVDPSKLEFSNTAMAVPRADRDRDRWARLIDEFIRVHVSAFGDPTGFRDELEDKRRGLNDPGTGLAFRALLSECRPTAYLQSIGRAICNERDMRSVSAAQIIDEVQERADGYYRDLWSTSSRDERLALFDLAQDGFINSENPGVPSLFRRGLVVRSPELRPLNESFRRFILKAGTAEEIHKWEEANAPNRWNAVRWPVLAAAAFGAFLLFVTHREMFDTGVFFVGALGGSVAGIFKLLEVFKSTRPAS